MVEAVKWAGCPDPAEAKTEHSVQKIKKKKSILPPSGFYANLSTAKSILCRYDWQFEGFLPTVIKVEKHNVECIIFKAVKN